MGHARGADIRKALPHRHGSRDIPGTLGLRQAGFLPTTKGCRRSCTTNKIPVFAPSVTERARPRHHSPEKMHHTTEKLPYAACRFQQTVPGLWCSTPDSAAS